MLSAYFAMTLLLTTGQNASAGPTRAVHMEAVMKDSQPEAGQLP